MSRQLPTRPNLEYLRKDAKDLLERLQQRNPSAQLADAQHVLAREYGFASWPKLKAFVEAQRASTVDVSPFEGTWKAIVDRSSPHPDNPFRQAVLHLHVAGDRVTIEDVVVDDGGREERHVNSLVADGREHTAESGHGYTLTATWRAARVLETAAFQHGTPAGWGRYEVSTDGRTLTVTADRVQLVFERIVA